MSQADARRSPVIAKYVLLVVANGVLLIALLYAVLSRWDRGALGPMDPDRCQGALRKIECLGGDVPHELALPQEYRLRLLDITLGNAWTGGNEGLALLQTVLLQGKQIAGPPSR